MLKQTKTIALTNANELQKKKRSKLFEYNL